MNARSFMRRARGIVQVELAVLMVTMAFLLPLIFSMGRIFYVYIVLKQNTATVANYLATLPQAEWNSATVMGNSMRNRMFDLSEKGLIDAGVAPAIPLFGLNIACDGDKVCGGERHETVSVTQAVHVPLGYVITRDLGLPETLTIQTTVIVPYTR
jgi:Flp pilus assembly protein TadG